MLKITNTPQMTQTQTQQRKSPNFGMKLGNGMHGVLDREITRYVGNFAQPLSQNDANSILIFARKLLRIISELPGFTIKHHVGEKENTFTIPTRFRFKDLEKSSYKKNGNVNPGDIIDTIIRKINTIKEVYQSVDDRDILPLPSELAPKLEPGAGKEEIKKFTKELKTKLFNHNDPTPDEIPQHKITPTRTSFDSLEEAQIAMRGRKIKGLNA